MRVFHLKRVYARARSRVYVYETHGRRTPSANFAGVKVVLNVYCQSGSFAASGGWLDGAGSETAT